MRPRASAIVLLLVLVFLIGPFLIIVAASLSAGETLAFPPRGLSLRWFAKVFEVESFRASFLLSLGLAIGATVAALCLGIPAAYALSRYKVPFGETLRTIVSSPIIVPGIVNNALTALGLTDQPIRILFSETAVFIGLLQLLLPLMIISLVSALENLPRDAISAARVLGANGFQTFWKVVLPLTREGLAIGGTLVFAGSMTAYITPAVLGGSKVLMLETLLYQRVSVANDIVSAGVIAFILIVLSFSANLLMKRIAKARSA